MLVLGLQGSPRKKGNTAFLLSTFLKEAEGLGAETITLDVAAMNIEPCKELTVCERKGYCPIRDDMDPKVYPLLRRAEVIVMATPIFFYNVPAQLKALIDRCQTLWARRYRLELSDPARNQRRGFLLAQGATRGKNLFEGVNLTARYFYDAVGSGFNGSLTYWRIENKGDMEKHPTVRQEVQSAVKELLDPLLARRKVLFACRENAGRSQMAAAFAQSLFGDKLEALCAGSRPAEAVNPLMVEVMAEKGIDMAFRIPRSIEDVLSRASPEVIVTMGCGEECPFVPGAKREDWDLPDPAGQDIGFMRRIRDDIEGRVKDFMGRCQGIVTGNSKLETGPA